MKKILAECNYLIHLVRCAIHNLQPREPEAGLDLQIVYEFGAYHQVANIAFYSVEKLKNKPEAELYSKWQACRDLAIMLDINQNYAASEIRESLGAAGIRLLELQGTKIKQFYPQSDWRTMSDIDFVIDQENIPKAAEILTELGYHDQDMYLGELNAYRPVNINIELHTEYFVETSEYREVLHSPFDSVDENGQCKTDAFYLYNILHIAKHYFDGGCGLRRVLDMYYLNQNCGSLIDRKRTQEALEKVGLTKFAADFGELADAWFGREEQAFPDGKMVRYVITSGHFGTLAYGRMNRMAKVIDKNDRFAKQKYVLRRVFPSGEILRTRYPVLERHKILYPFCWVHRGVCALLPGSFKRIRKEVEAVKMVDTTEE